MNRVITTHIIVVSVLFIFNQASTASDLPAKLPSFSTTGHQAHSRIAQSIEVADDSIVNVFYTGKPSEPDSETYLFKYRNYAPALTRWLSNDPSGFPDGANNSSYLPQPTCEFDFQGLIVTGWYSITQKKLHLENMDTMAIQEWTVSGSGDNDYSHRNDQGGPIPTGYYSIFSRDQFNTSYYGHAAFILDPNDSTKFNDTWDEGDAQDRNAFRIHVVGNTDGCIVASAIDSIAAFIQNSSYSTATYHITSPGSAPNDFYEFYLGTLEVIE